MSDLLVQESYLKILQEIVEDPGRDGLKDTPKRAARAMQFLMQGYGMDIDEVINNALFDSDTDEMVIVKNIELYSMCEHHMLPFIGKCHIAYLPNKKSHRSLQNRKSSWGIRATTSNSGKPYKWNCQLYFRKNRGCWSCSYYRSATYVYDDARSRKAEFGDDHFLYAGSI